jgi:hypothetical protein
LTGSVGIAFLIMLFCWIWLQIIYTLDIEAFQVKTSSLIKKALTNNNSSFANEFVFIDISGNKQLVPRDDGSGDDLITNRAKLDTFFRFINKNSHYRYILCDVFFEKILPGDSAFRETLAATPRLIIPENETEEGIQPALFTETEQGLTSYSISSGYHSSSDLVKYPLLHTPSARSIPLMMHERITGQRSASLMGLLWQKGRVSFNHFIPSFRIEPEHLNIDSVNKVMPLNYLLQGMTYADSTFYDNIFRDKYIVIGDFKTDYQSTVLGPMPGPLILANIYLALREGDNNISIWWILYVWMAFTLLAYLVFFPPKKIRQWENKLIGSAGNILFALEELALSMIVLWLLSLISYLLFNKHLDVVVPSVLLSILALVIKIRNHQQKNTNTPNTFSAS